METHVIATFHNVEDDFVLGVAEIINGFSVVLFDIEAELFADVVRIFTNVDAAFEYAEANIIE